MLLGNDAADVSVDLKLLHEGYKTCLLHFQHLNIQYIYLLNVM